MSEQNRIELELEVMDLTRRLDRIEGDTAKLDTRLKNIEEQLTAHNTNMKRFWEKDWPQIESIIKDTRSKLDQLTAENVDARVASAVSAEKDKHLISNLERETQTLKNELQAQRSLIVKLLLSAAGGGGTVVALVEAAKTLMGG